MKTALIALAMLSSSAFASQACTDATAAVTRNGFQVIDGKVYYASSSAQCAGNEILLQGWVGTCNVGYTCVNKDVLYGLSHN